MAKSDKQTSDKQAGSGGNLRFAGCGAIVTGAGSGIGRETTLAFAEQGANVYGTDISAEALAATAKMGAGLPGAIAVGVHDVASRASCFEAVDGARDALGSFNVLCNIAGISWAEHVVNVTEEMWNKMMGVNLSGVFWMSQAALPHLLEVAGADGGAGTDGGAGAGGGTDAATDAAPEIGTGGLGGDDTQPSPSIVNIASTAGLMGQAYTVPYCATKGGVVLLTKSMAMEFAKTSLRVNAVAPGGVDTSLAQNFQMPGDVDVALVQRYWGFRGMSHPRAMANAVLFLASAEANRIHGAVLSVDAGMTAG